MDRKESLSPLSTFSKYISLAALLVASSTLAILLQPSSSHELPQLRMRLEAQHDDQSPTAVIKIMQMADLHFGEAENLDWGPEQDIKSLRAMQAVLHKEQPDFVVLSGDQLTANNMLSPNATKYYEKIVAVLIEHGVPWAMVFGNHDDMPFEGDTYTMPAPWVSREQLLAFDMQYENSYTQASPPGVTGATNYVVEIFPPVDGDSSSAHGGIMPGEAAALIYFLDSGGGTLPEAIDDTQLQWYRDTSQRLGTRVPAIAFQHIPVPEFRLAKEPGAFASGQCKGFFDDDISPIHVDMGVVSEMMAQGNIHVLAAGHNHGNDYCCHHGALLHLCYGRHSGYGGYGTWDRGARVYELRVRLDETGTFTWRSWVRMEDGRVVDVYQPGTAGPLHTLHQVVFQ